MIEKSATEFIPITTRVYDKSVKGCQKFDKDILVLLVLDAKEHFSTPFVDIFLTEEQAWRLAKDLLDKLHSNKELLKQEQE